MLLLFFSIPIRTPLCRTPDFFRFQSHDCQPCLKNKNKTTKKRTRLRLIGIGVSKRLQVSPKVFIFSSTVWDGVLVTFRFRWTFCEVYTRSQEPRYAHVPYKPHIMPSFHSRPETFPSKLNSKIPMMRIHNP